MESSYLIALALIAASGFFSLFEGSLRSARMPRLKKEADDSARRGRAERYRRVQKAAENPGQYYAAARVWVCILRTVAVVLVIKTPVPLAIGTAALILAFLIIGDLIPRIIARIAPESIAAGIFPLFRLLALPLKPIFLLAETAAEKLRLGFLTTTGDSGMTEVELRHALIEGEKSGIVESKERTIVENVFYLGDRPLGAFMKHRSEVQWLDINALAEEIRAKVLENRDQRCFPVADGTLDEIIGMIFTEDVILDCASEAPAGLRAIMRKAQFAPETMPALKAFESFRQGQANFLFVMDEYGGFAGMVSLRALMEEIVGELAAPARQEEQAVKKADGSWIASGALHIDDAAELLSMPDLAACGDYHTLAGFVLSLAGELPAPGDSFEYQGYRFHILDMDGNRIDRIEIRKIV
ncbi:MAG: hemolysin family protein [Treponema sp.]|nr:hemolysin family protein [Treponema sp.]